MEFSFGMKKTTFGIMLSLFFVFSFGITFAADEPYGVDSVTVKNSERYDTSAITPKQVNALAGNVTELSLNATAVTKYWQGFYGNVTGEIILADASGNNFYNWNLTIPSGQVFASRSNAVTWTTINCSNETQISQEETYLGQTATDPDSVSNTFTLTSHPSFMIGSTTIAGCYSTKAYDSSGGQAVDDFWQILLSDDTNIVYSTIIEDSAISGFNNLPWHFELLVGEKGTDEATTPYYFYVQIE